MEDDEVSGGMDWKLGTRVQIKTSPADERALRTAQPHLLSAQAEPGPDFKRPRSATLVRGKRRPILGTKSESDTGAVLGGGRFFNGMKYNRSFYHRKSTLESKPGPKFTNKQKLVFLSLCLGNISSFAAMSIMVPFFPKVAREKGVPMTVSGLIFSTYAFVIFAASPFMGTICAHVGAKFLFNAGLFVAGSCSILFGFLNLEPSSHVFTFWCFAVRISEALGAAAYNTASYTFVAQIFPDHVSFVVGSVEACLGLGMCIGRAIGGILYDWGGYGLPFYTVGGVMLLTIPFNLYLLPASNKTEKARGGSMLGLLRIPPVLVIVLTIVVLSSSWGFMDPVLEPHFLEFGLSGKDLGLIFLLMSVVYGFSSPMWSLLADRMTQTWVLMVVGLFCSAFGIILLGPAPFLGLPNTIWLNVVALVIIGLSMSMALLPTFEAMLDYARDEGFRNDVSTFGLIAGLWSSVYSLGEVIGPTLGATLTEHFGFPTTACIMATLCVLMGFGLIGYFVSIYRQPRQSYLLCSGDRAKLLDQESKKRTMIRNETGPDLSLISQWSTSSSNESLGNGNGAIAYRQFTSESTPLLGRPRRMSV